MTTWSTVLLHNKPIKAMICTVCNHEDAFPTMWDFEVCDSTGVVLLHHMGKGVRRCTPVSLDSSSVITGGGGGGGTLDSP